MAGPAHRPKLKTTTTLATANNVSPSTSTPPSRTLLSTSTRGLGNGCIDLPPEEILFDDLAAAKGSDDYVNKNNTMHQVANRLLRRIQHMMISEASIEGGDTPGSFVVHIAGHLNEEQQRLVGVIEEAMDRATKHGQALATYNQTYEDLRHAVVAWYTFRLEQATTNLRKIFDRHKEVFDDLLGLMTGLLDHDNKGSSLDHVIGDQLEALRYRVCITKERESIMEQAFEMGNSVHLQERLKGILKKTALAKEVYSHIFMLGCPERAVGTLTRLAHLPVVRGIRFIHSGSNVLPNTKEPPGMTGTKCTSVTTVIQTDAHTSFYKPSALSSHTKPINIVPSGTGTGIRNSGSRRGSVGEPVRTISEGSKRTKAYYASRKTKPGKEQDAADVFFAKARLYLSPPDRETGPNWLQPEAKRQTFLLAAWLSNTANPPPCWSCYYDFGYVTCQNEDEAQLLGGLYNAVLNDPDRGPKEATFEQLWQALDTPSLLIDLLDSCGYLDALRTQLPRLEHFLGTRSEDRPSVWRLIQFVRDTPNTEPHACLRRDYGFDSCTLRDEVQALKYIYGEVLAMTATTTKTTTTTQTQTHPLQLHAACIRGTLFEFARSKAGAVIVRDEHRRLMQNMAPSSPFIGFDNDKGLKGYTAPLFKKLQK